ncbi:MULTISPECIES: hypothetical protein [Bacillus]|uniref:Uncharacterized protein n=2 Tax=Bacillus thuringiensis TaxID=1428 RepID=A0AAP4Q6Q8_BACTU|nr:MULTISPECIES: hypothetical protein [Bacillus]MEC0048147.1 hypothetical protein [Bacillus cereus]AFV21433.1 hypothetical protein BTB_502p00970 [Bacillus thuringiensis Bt407]EEM25533.1 hypothetical protein bthur0002_61760 [Bacillus thuringiensis Bt407]ERI01391.1 hypothetical protein BTCBT_002979 [Bacillus thuringiensis T01-328]MBN6708119.1 hypothetical protein [Bacillus thuringiensis]
MCKKQMIVSPQFTRDIQNCLFCNEVAEMHVQVIDMGFKVSGHFCKKCVNEMELEKIEFCPFQNLVSVLRKKGMQEWIVVTNKKYENNNVVFKKMRFRKKSRYFIEMEVVCSGELNRTMIHESDFKLMLEDIVYGNWFIEKEKEVEKQ